MRPTSSPNRKESKGDAALAFKVRLRFGRDEAASWYPHQAVMNAFSRAARMSGIPVRFTEGFDPHPRITIPYALSVGIPGDVEALELELHSWCKPSEVAARLNAFLPRGIRVNRARLVPPRRASFVVTAACYEAVLPAEALPGAPEAVERLLAAEEWVVERGGKKKRTVDIRPYIESLELEGATLSMRLKVTGRGTARPREIAAAVVGDGFDVRLVPIRKTKLEIRDAD